MSSVLTFKERFIKSASWSLTGNLTGQAIRFASSLIMTRLLVPEDFGLMAIVMVLMVGFTLLSDLGTTQSLIYNKRGEEAAFRHTVWTLQVARGFVIWTVSVLVSAVIIMLSRWGWFPHDSTYNDPRLPLVIVVFSSQMIVLGFCSSKQWIQQRHLMLKRIMLIRFYSQVISLAVMVAWGYFSRDIWALVAGGLVSAVVQVVMSHTYLPGEPDRFGWDKAVFKDLLHFGRWVMLSSIIGFLASGGDRLLLGALENAKSLGIYSIAFLLLTPIQGMFITTIGSVVFPALSEIHRNSPERVSEIYARFQRFADLGLVGAAGILFMGSPALVSLMYDHRYQEAGVMLQTLGLSLIGMRTQVLEQLFIAKGESRLNTAASFFRLLGLAVLVPVAHWLGGLNWAVSAIVAATFSAWPLAYWYRHKHRMSWRQADAWAIPAFLGGLAGGWLITQAVRWLDLLR